MLAAWLIMCALSSEVHVGAGLDEVGPERWRSAADAYAVFGHMTNYEYIAPRQHTSAMTLMRSAWSVEGVQERHL